MPPLRISQKKQILDPPNEFDAGRPMAGSIDVSIRARRSQCAVALVGALVDGAFVLAGGVELSAAGLHPLVRFMSNSPKAKQNIIFFILQISHPPMQCQWKIYRCFSV